jgi:predicted N-formylglutamate amidohydrolase
MMMRSEFFAEDEPGAVTVVNPEGASDLLLICEHASRRLPLAYGNLGLPDEVLQAHVSWDPGALAVSQLLSKSLDATLIYQNYSRLIYDCNRPPEAAGAMPEKSEIFDIAANQNLSAHERYARTSNLYIPFHDAIDAIISNRRRQNRSVVVATMHSFTPVYFGQKRDVEIGILHDDDSRLADRMLAKGSHAKWRVERNQPYGPQDGVTHTLRLHALPSKLENVMIEIRNDLVADRAGEEDIALYLHDLLTASLPAQS